MLCATVVGWASAVRTIQVGKGVGVWEWARWRVGVIQCGSYPAVHDRTETQHTQVRVLRARCGRECECRPGGAVLCINRCGSECCLHSRVVRGGMQSGTWAAVLRGAGVPPVVHHKQGGLGDGQGGQRALARKDKGHVRLVLARCGLRSLHWYPGSLPVPGLSCVRVAVHAVMSSMPNSNHDGCSLHFGNHARCWN